MDTSDRTEKPARFDRIFNVTPAPKHENGSDRQHSEGNVQAKKNGEPIRPVPQVIRDIHCQALYLKKRQQCLDISDYFLDSLRRGTEKPFRPIRCVPE